MKNILEYKESQLFKYLEKAQKLGLDSNTEGNEIKLNVMNIQKELSEKYPNIKDILEFNKRNKRI